MFEDFDQLYPTPPELVAQMIQPFTHSTRHYNWDSGKRHLNLPTYSKILDPQAGKGDLLAAVNDQLATNHNRYAIEIDPDLRLILAGKGIAVVETDLLEVAEFDRHYGLILSNPPFNRGCAHALHLYRLMADGADLCIVLNAETIRNPFSDERQLLLKLIEDHGWVEEVGQPFKEAERPTDVECCLVYLHKPASQTVDWAAAGLEDDEAKPTIDFEEPNALANRDTIALYVHAYQQAIAAQLRMEQATKERAYWLRGVSKPYREGQSSAIQDSDDIAAGFWNVIFEATQIGRRTTSRFQNEFKAHLAANQNLAFNERNIRQILDMFVRNSREMLEQCISDAFDMTIRYHEDNRLHTEGWKTNDSYRCNRRFIIPYGPTYDRKQDRFDNFWCYRNNLTDLDRALCFLTGLDIEKIRTSVESIRYLTDQYNHERGWRRPRHDMPFSSTFFDPMRIFKKGTIHITFEDERLWMEFNIRAARQKGWLPNKQKSPPKRRRQSSTPLQDNEGRVFHNIAGIYEWQDTDGKTHQIPVDQTIRDEDEETAFAAAVDWTILATTPDFHHRFADDTVAKLTVGPATAQEAKLLTAIDWTEYQPALPALAQPDLFMEPA